MILLSVLLMFFTSLIFKAYQCIPVPFCLWGVLSESVVRNYFSSGPVCLPAPLSYYSITEWQRMNHCCLVRTDVTQLTPVCQKLITLPSLLPVKLTQTSAPIPLAVSLYCGLQVWSWHISFFCCSNRNSNCCHILPKSDLLEVTNAPTRMTCFQYSDSSKIL